ncbi:MAG: DNA polymerase [Acidimicrobiales bacterium]
MELGTGDPAAVAPRLISSAAGLAPFARAVAECVALAVDTETHIGTGRLRVVSAATRDPAGIERAWVIDARDTDPTALAPILAGRIAAGWNANFDAAVLDAAVFDPAGTPALRRLRWFDAMFADALLHQGRSGFAFYHGLAWAARHYLGVETEGKGTVQLSYDLDSDLSAAQIAYAGADAVTTLWVADRIGAAVRAAGLSEVAGLEMAARPFLDQLSRRGFPFDADGYRAFLADQQTALHRCESELAELTGGGQGNLFSTEVEPTWNPASEAQAKVALNRHAAADVHAYFARAEGRARGLEPHDPLTATVLAEIGGPVAGALLRYRHHAKLVSTYGDSLLAHVGADGRIRPQYLQVVGTSTGRLASRYPNAQNLAPETKPFVRPADGRVLVHADLSQAELRWMAQVSGDRALQAALADGGDVHVATAARMFGEDVAALRERDPARYGELRARAKAINFGILYGLGARALARSLSRPGAEVTVEAAQQLLDAYLAAYPGVAAWLRGHDRVVDELAAHPPPVDWARSFELLDGFDRLGARQKAFKAQHNRAPSLAELLEDPALGPQERVRWLAGFHSAVVLTADGPPLGWETRTLAGRRRLFDVGLWGVLRSAAVRAAQRSDPRWAALRDAVADEHGVRLANGAGPLSEAELQRIFDDRPLRLALVQRVGVELGVAARDQLLDRALADRIAVLGNAHRNAPIQGGVADAMLAAFGRLWRTLADDPEVWPTQTVHDSVVLECPAERAAEVARLLHDALAAAMARFCPDVAVRVDVDVRRSLAEAVGEPLELTRSPAGSAAR